jgi:hypothetical protein
MVEMTRHEAMDRRVEGQAMGEGKRTRRWVVIAIAVMIGLAAGTFITLRPMIMTKPARVVSRRADDALYQAMPPIQSPERTWIEGDGTSTSPEGYPVKANQRSGIYHLPGDLAYERTIPTRAYRSADAAEADGYRHAYR